MGGVGRPGKPETLGKPPSQRLFASRDDARALGATEVRLIRVNSPAHRPWQASRKSTSREETMKAS